MGGGGATGYGQKHSDMYAAVYAMSALMSIPDGSGTVAKPDDSGNPCKSVIENSCVDFVANADEDRIANLRTVGLVC